MLIEPDILMAALFTMAGTFLFLRLAGKEAHRRDKYLEIRLLEKIEEMKKADEESVRATAEAQSDSD